MNQRIITKSAAIVFALSMIMLSACYNDNEETLYGNTPTGTCDLTTAVKFSTVVSPIIANSCATAGCHSVASKASGINLGTYDAIKAYATGSKAVFLGSMKRESSYSPMPKGNSKLADCDISKIESWITAGTPNN
jgi:hypothetical protein